LLGVELYCKTKIYIKDVNKRQFKIINYKIKIYIDSKLNIKSILFFKKMYTKLKLYNKNI